MILAGDVGGTKTLLGLFTRARGKLRAVHERSFQSQESPSLEGMVRAFLAGQGARVHACAVGVAGPVVGGKSDRVNLAWRVEERKLARVLGLGHARVINDLEANAWGIAELSPRRMMSLTPGLRPSPGNAALISAGTGLGMAILAWDGERHRPSASEGGHQGFAPRDAQQVELLEFLRERHGRVSVERVVSGPGISAIYEFLLASGNGPESDLMKRRRGEGDPNPAITEAAMAGEDALAARALDLFVSLYGAAAGDLALVARATAGVYLGGGIAPRILPRLRDGAFLRAFRDKGRLTPFLERIPVKVILEPKTALIGAAACAAHERKPRRELRRR